MIQRTIVSIGERAEKFSVLIEVTLGTEFITVSALEC